MAPTIRDIARAEGATAMFAANDYMAIGDLEAIFDSAPNPSGRSASCGCSTRTGCAG
ncbi:MAG: hypothetical protein QME92_06965 [Bacillota bacterium]|nr:hypothetical protein [Bacillota bacterium]